MDNYKEGFKEYTADTLKSLKAITIIAGILTIAFSALIFTQPNEKEN